MQTGTYISGIAHTAVLGWAMISGSFFNTQSAPEIVIPDVSILTESQFAALMSNAPDIATDFQSPAQPAEDHATPRAPLADSAPEIPKATGPESPENADRQPDVSSISELPASEVQVESPDLSESPTTENAGIELALPDAVLDTAEKPGQSQPDQLAILDTGLRKAPRVDTQSAPEPLPDADIADDVQNAARPDDTTETPVEQADEQAPEQATSEIVTEANENDSDAAPVRSSRPRGRPAKLAERNSSSSAIEKALAQAQSEAAATSTSTRAVPLGPPLTAREKDGLRLSVQKCWNVNPSSEAARITVVIAVELSEDGKPRGGTLRQISATQGSADAVRSAYDAARRAVLRCGAKGFDLPQEKYDHWRVVEITFNPENMRNR